MIEYDELDPGIREVVRKLNEIGRETMDSGDGCSKDLSDPEVLPFAHVAVDPEMASLLTLSADTLLDDLGKIDGFPPGYRIEATYDPADRSAVLMLMWPGPLPAAAALPDVG